MDCVIPILNGEIFGRKEVNPHRRKAEGAAYSIQRWTVRRPLKMQYSYLNTVFTVNDHDQGLAHPQAWK
jgi:hypothetical protein